MMQQAEVPDFGGAAMAVAAIGEAKDDAREAYKITMVREAWVCRPPSPTMTLN
jgi:hypothetical protein